MSGARRFGELKKSINTISHKVLTQQLRSMEEDGIIERVVYADRPPRVEYSLTEEGTRLRPILTAMSTWGKEYKEHIIKDVK